MPSAANTAHRRRLALAMAMFLAVIALLPTTALAGGCGHVVALPTTQHRPEGDDAPDDDDDADKDKGKGKDADKDKGKGNDQPDDDDDADLTDLQKAQRAVAAANRENARLKREAAENERKRQKDAGKHQERADAAEARLKELEDAAELAVKTNLVKAALVKLKVKNPDRAVKLVDGLDKVEDEVDAEKVAKALLKSDDYLFDKTPSRQKKGAGKAPEKDDEDDDDAEVKPRRKGPRKTPNWSAPVG